MSEDAARLLWQAARMIRETEYALDAIVDTLDALLSEKKGEAVCFKYDGALGERDYDRWLEAEYTTFYKVTDNARNKKGPKERLGTVTLKTQLYSKSCDDSPTFGRARLFVAYSEGPDNQWEVADLDLDNDGRFENCRPRDGRRWYWVEDGEIPGDSWFYCVPLTSLEDRGSLERIVVKPLVALVEGKDENEAFAEVKTDELLMPPAPR